MKKLSVLALAMLVLSGCSGDDDANKDPQKTEMPSTSSDGDVSTTDSQAGNATTPPTMDTTVTEVSNSKLPKTGITKCGDYAYGGSGTHNNKLDCSLTTDSDGDPIPAKQDGHVQEGQTMAYETVTYSNNTSGSSVTETCIKDKVTGLIWEQKTDDNGLRDKDNTYFWYDPAAIINGKDLDRLTCKGSKCNTYAYIQSLNTNNYCGYNDWRMPTLMELVTILDYGRINPAVNLVFTNTQSYDYWSASPYADYSFYNNAWVVDFNKGETSFKNMSSNYHVRAVRASK